MNHSPRGLVRDAMSARAPRLTVDTSIAVGAHQVWRNGWLPMPVVDGEGRLVGALSSNDVVRAVAQLRDPQQSNVAEFAATDVPTVGPDTPLEEATAQMNRSGMVLAMVVEEDSRLVGTLTLTDLQGHELVERELGPLAAEVVTEVSPNDLMYAGSWGAYAYAGATALQCIREVLAKVGRPDPASILDLPCGHGRELRFLKVAYPQAHFGVCDIDEDGVDFCARVFGGHPIVSHKEPSEVVFDRQYELAWSGSLFTHLSAERWPGFLEMFARAVEPGGLVLFSANGYLSPQLLRNFGLDAGQVEQLLGDFNRDQFGYVEVSDGSWGLSLARPRWVKEQIERSPLELISYERGAWKPPHPPQDVAVCTVPA
jgi:CBS domain-containing protein